MDWLQDIWDLADLMRELRRLQRIGADLRMQKTRIRCWLVDRGVRSVPWGRGSKFQDAKLRALLQKDAQVANAQGRKRAGKRTNGNGHRHPAETLDLVMGLPGPERASVKPATVQFGLRCLGER